MFKKTLAVVLAVLMLLIPTTILAEKSQAEIDREVNEAVMQLLHPQSRLMAMFKGDFKFVDEGKKLETAAVMLRGDRKDVPTTFFYNNGGFKGNLKFAYKEVVVINGEKYTLVKYSGVVTKK